MMTALGYCLIALLVLLCLGSLLNLLSHPHWFIRGWDFPRVQMVVLGWAITALVGILDLAVGFEPGWFVWAALAMSIFLTGWHGWRIYPYSFIAEKQAKPTPPRRSDDHRDDVATIRVVISNVEMENDQFQKWLNVMEDAQPDILIALETDERWETAIHNYSDSFRHKIVVPQDNWYGMMMMSNLPVVEHQIRYLVQEDIPSIDAELKLPNDQSMRVIAVHPRPPEPLRDTDATARDAELILWGDELEDETRPTIIGGDLNDVAWSHTTRLFLRTSEMLDPRRGRGFFNTFHAQRPYMRFPLDHIFHSPHFTITRIELLPEVGSDHFPILLDLQYAPEDKKRHEVLDERERDDQQIEDQIERAVEDDEMKGEAVDEETEQDAGERSDERLPTPSATKNQ